MARSLPFYSANPGARAVFHNNDACQEGKRIEPTDWRAGDGERRLCEECARLNAAQNGPRQAT